MCYRRVCDTRLAYCNILYNYRAIFIFLPGTMVYRVRYLLPHTHTHTHTYSLSLYLPLSRAISPHYLSIYLSTYMYIYMFLYINVQFSNIDSRRQSTTLRVLSIVSLLLKRWGSHVLGSSRPSCPHYACSGSFASRQKMTTSSHANAC